MGPVELLRTLNKVFAYLDESHDVDVRDEPPEVAGPRIMQFLRVLKVAIPEDPEAA
jgi:hypothetical protein